jgi:hypothetical protein
MTSRTDSENPEPQTRLGEADLRELAAASATRADLWAAIVTALEARDVAEIGVYRGDFAARLLLDCEGIARYYMIDSWRHLEDWNKPANKADDVFEQFLQETMDKTSSYAGKRVVLRGRTSEVIDQVPDESLDFAYIDADHTLRGITIDLVKVYPKVKEGGWIGGDDFRRSIWQHGEKFEPTLVFPFAVFFAEAVGARIYGLPHSQFLIEKAGGDGFEFVDLTGTYRDTGLRTQFARQGAPRRSAAKSPPSFGARLKRRLSP